MSRLDYTYQHLHTLKTRFQYISIRSLASTSSLINIDQLPLHGSTMKYYIEVQSHVRLIVRVPTLTFTFMHQDPPSHIDQD